MKTIKTWIISIAVILFLASCFLSLDKPAQKDGLANIAITVKVDTSDGMELAINVPVTLETYDYNIKTLYDTTDSNGRVEFRNIPFASYMVRSFIDIIFEDETRKIGGAVKVDVFAGDDYDSIKVDSIQMGSYKGLKINEMYSAGPINNIFYFYDQFFELYNYSDTTVYLDGMVFLRLGTSELFADTLRVTNIYQFPGTPKTGREYPMGPGEFVVLAQKAFNHNLIGPIKGKTVDLSNADWEFFNMIEPGAYNNPNVPNITTNNGQVTQKSKVDFMVGVTGDGIALCDGTDYDQTDGIDINTVIDCIEISSSPTHTKEVPYSLDADFGGIGLTKYSGQSVERLWPGFDTNNSAIDFIIREKPTPGYQYESNN
ncbi:MAG: DUF4876 domain-containing protein [Candidatus Marinimicrobia bacterium]|nr:DUF4876 domain-containing protein [Candidatus Neomarinimicrobiota bacterium]